MKKQTFQGLLCLFGGMIASVAFIGLMFSILHWPGGHAMMCKIVPALIAILFVILGFYVFRFGALKALVEKGVAGAKQLQVSEGIAFMLIALLICGFLLRTMHIPGGSQLVMISCFALAILAALIGSWASIVIKNK